MANTTTIPKTCSHTALQRVEASDLIAISELGLDLDKEAAWALLSATNCVIDGLHVTQASGVEMAISNGAALYGGQVLKGLSLANVALDTNPDPDPRIDVVYIANPATTPDTSTSKVLLSAYTRTPVAAEPVGTGDDSTTAFDLAQSRVDGRTLKVQLDAAPAGGWNLSPGTGTAGVDQIIFGTAPAGSVAITADYTWESGGAEASSSVSVRNIHLPEILVTKGTSASSPLVPTTPSPTTDIVLANITIPAGWTGDASPSAPVIDNTVKRFFLHPDQNVDPSVNITPTPPSATAPRAGRVSSALRNLDQLYMGGRLRYINATTIGLSAMWGTLAGISIHNPDDSITLTLQDSSSGSAGYVDAVGWWYVYLSRAVDLYPGTAPSLIVSQSPPNNRRRESATASAIYVGAIYLTAYSTPVIRPFYTHGQWVFWEAPTAITIATGTNDQDVSVWCPSTGRLCYAKVVLDGQAASLGDRRTAALRSHRNATAKTEPLFQCALEPTQASSGSQGYATGMVRAEESELSRFVHTTRADDIGSFSSDTSEFYILGYLDDYRTMDSTGGPDADPVNAAPSFY